jgi:hypothetical protein
MKITFSSSALRQFQTHELALRFVLGGLVTVVTGLITMQFGPVVGGLFLAFPAILPASMSLIQKHEMRKKQEQGLNGRQRARYAAGVEAAGAMMGSLGFFGFGLVVWRFAPHYDAWLVLFGATIAWFAVAIAAWTIHKSL